MAIGLLMVLTIALSCAKQEAPPIPKDPEGDLYAIVVGISSYENPDIPDLNNAAKEALDFSHYLQSQRALFKNIHVKTIIGRRATKERIERTMEQGFKLAGPNDHMISFFSCYGVIDSDAQQGFHFMVYDSDPNDLDRTGLFMNLNQLTAKNNTKSSIMIMNTRHSPRVGDPDPGTARDRLLRLINCCNAEPNRLLLASVIDHNKDRLLHKEDNKRFTDYLLEGLKGKADLNQDGRVIASEAHEYVLSRMKDQFEQARPVIFEGMKRDPFILGKPGAAMAREREEFTGPKGDLYAMVIGVSEYENDEIMDLAFAAKDARDFGAFLSRQTGIFNHIYMDLLTDSQATRNNINRLLKASYKIAKPEDTMLMFFSGHGLAVPGREDEYHVYVHDTDPDRVLETGLLLSSMRMIKDVPTERAIVISDTCSAGAAVDLQSESGGMTIDEFAKVFRTNPNKIVISSSRTPEQSLEFPQLENGVFTHFLLKGLMGGADLNRDNIVTVEEAYDYTSTRTCEFTHGAQNPTFEGRLEGLFPLSRVSESSSRAKRVK
jgi:uncharacterized caspase-like protein